MSRNHSSHVLCYIAAAVICCITALPFYVLFNMSVRSIHDLGSKLRMPDAVNWDNYVQAFTESGIWRGFLNSLIVVILAVAMIILFSSMAAYGLSRARTRLAGYIGTVNLTVMMIPPVSLLVGTYSLMVAMKLVNTLPGLSLLSAATGIPAALFLYSSFMVTVPRDLDEAAMIDGAGILTTFFRIIFPQLKSVTITQMIISAIGCWNEYLMPMYLLQNSKKHTLILVIKSAFNSFNGVANLPLAAATCVIGIVPVIVFYLALQKYIIKGQIEGISK